MRVLYRLLAVFLVVAAVGGGYLVAPLVIDCGSDGFDHRLAGEATVEASPGSEQPGEVTVTFADDGQTHPLHPCDADGGDAPVDQYHVQWETLDGGNVSVAEGSATLTAERSATLTEEGDQLVLREETAGTDTTVRLLIIGVTPDGDRDVLMAPEVTL